jgi:hypothetical protein
VTLGSKINAEMPDIMFTLNDHEVQILDGPYRNGCEPTSDAHEFAVTLIQSLDDMRVFAAQQYLKIYNDTWRKKDAPLIDEATFCNRLTNPRIVLYDEVGMAVVYFDDSEMFAGHSIEVSIDEGNMTHASIVG